MGTSEWQQIKSNISFCGCNDQMLDYFCNYWFIFGWCGGFIGRRRGRGCSGHLFFCTGGRHSVLTTPPHEHRTHGRANREDNGEEKQNKSSKRKSLTVSVQRRRWPSVGTMSPECCTSAPVLIWAAVKRIKNAFVSHKQQRVTSKHSDGMKDSLVNSSL